MTKRGGGGGGGRPRTARREAERDARRLVRDRERLFALEPGGSPERPLDVSTAALVEPRARATPCPQCGGELDVLEHEVVAAAAASVRVVRARCRACHAPRALYFRLPSGPS